MLNITFRLIKIYTKGRKRAYLQLQGPSSMKMGKNGKSHTKPKELQMKIRIKNNKIK